MKLHLALPFAAADAFGSGQRKHAAFINRTCIESAAPVGRAEPGLKTGGAVPKVLAVLGTAAFTRDFAEHDVGDGDLRSCRYAAEVEHQHHGRIRVSLVNRHGYGFIGVRQHLVGFEGHAVVVEEFAPAGIVVGRALDCDGAGCAGCHLAGEAVLLGRVDGDAGMKLHLALPFASADALGGSERKHAALVNRACIESAAPVGGTEPGLKAGGAVPEVRTISVCRRSVGFLGLVFGKYGAVVDCMVLKDYVADGNLRIVGVASEIEHHLHCSSIDAGHVAEPEYEVLESLDVPALGEQEVAVVGSVGELEGHSVHILRERHLHREVIVQGGAQGNVVHGDDEELVLPLV